MPDGSGSCNGPDEGGGDGPWKDHCMKKNSYAGCASAPSLPASASFERMSGIMKLGELFAVLVRVSYVEVGTDADKYPRPVPEEREA